MNTNDNWNINDFTETLAGHISPDTAVVIDDYPYGFRLRTQIRYWIETKKGFGQRCCSQTKNPKTGAWNKAKAGNYHEVCIIIRNPSNGHVWNSPLNYNDNEEEIAKFEQVRGEGIGDYERNAIRHIRAHNAACAKLTWSCGPAKLGEAHQTIEEQAAIIDALTRAELAKADQ